MQYVFFTMNDFVKEGGGTIRMYGILNELVNQGNKVTLISNAKSLVKFKQDIEHIHIDHRFEAKDKRVFQGLTGFLPLFLATLKYRTFLNKLKAIIQQNSLDNCNIIFFEYLDNTIGYVLKKKKIILSYTNDLHGIATVEFKFQADHAKNFSEKLKFLTKYYISNLLDTKVFSNAYGLVFASRAMKQFYINLYPKISGTKSVVIPYVLSSDAFCQSADLDLKAKLLVDLNLRENDRVILFAGAFKKTGGVPDLIEAFSDLISEQKNLKLILVGDGPTMAECRGLVKQKGIEKEVYFIGRTLYEYLRTYQDIATIIVCPDKMNLYSDLIIHVKYLDALISGKIVVNGSFKSVKEVNIDDTLSVSFEPSDVKSLTNAIDYCIKNLSLLKTRYKDNPKYVSENLTYSNFVNDLKEMVIMQ